MISVVDASLIVAAWHSKETTKSLLIHESDITTKTETRKYSACVRITIGLTVVDDTSGKLLAVHLAHVAPAASGW